MAVQIAYNYKGLVAPVAYVRLLDYQVVKDDTCAHFVVGVYVTAAQRALTPRTYLDQVGFTVRDEPAVLNPDGTVAVPARSYFTDLFSDTNLRLAGQSPERSCYVYLKTQPGYQSGVDV